MENIVDLKKKMLELIEEPFDSATLVCFKQKNDESVDVKTVFNNMNGSTMLYLLEWVAYSIFKAPIVDPYLIVTEAIHKGWTKAREEAKIRQEKLQNESTNTTPSESQTVPPIIQEVISDKIEDHKNE